MGGGGAALGIGGAVLGGITGRKSKVLQEAQGPQNPYLADVYREAQKLYKGGEFGYKAPSSTYQNRFLTPLVEDVRRQSTEAFTQDVLPQLQSQYSQAGRYGSNAMANAVARATEGAQRGLTGQLTQLQAGEYGNVYQDELARQQQAALSPYTALQRYKEFVGGEGGGLATPEIRQKGPGFLRGAISGGMGALGLGTQMFGGTGGTGFGSLLGGGQ